MRAGEVRALRMRDFQLRWNNGQITGGEVVVAKSKTEAGTGRLIPLSKRVCACLSLRLGYFPNAEPESYLFPFHQVGIGGNSRSVTIYGADLTRPPNGLFNLSRLAVWWLRLGITIERIQPGHPQQNGRHERMHRTLKMEATRPAGSNFLQQQAKFDAFIHEFNHERPHEALDMKYPVEVYKPSTRPYQKDLAEIPVGKWECYHRFTRTLP